ncbi:peptidylprolyl isomerase [Roseovarius sp. E0-M6]|uniref:peptidylprolyl isomerase n=1 Tax=Roseovarius sp. E0-M6 TaxID=3127118 RepID=UPI00300FE4AA
MLNSLRPLTFAAVFTMSAAGVPTLADEAPTADTVVATVNGTDITLGHMIVLRAGLPQQVAELPAEILFEGILDQLIQQAILEENFEGELSKTAQLTLENERRAIIAGEILARISKNAITDEAVQQVYQENYAESAKPTEFKASHILVESEEKANELVASLKDGAEFATLAREHSTGPSGPNGGALGWFTADMMVEPFGSAVAEMEPGSVSNPVETQFGWHVIKLEETRLQGTPDLAEVRGEIEEQIRQEAVQARIEELSKAVEVNRDSAETMDPSVLNNIDLLEE